MSKEIDEWEDYEYYLKHHNGLIVIAFYGTQVQVWQNMRQEFENLAVKYDKTLFLIVSYIYHFTVLDLDGFLDDPGGRTWRRPKWRGDAPKGWLGKTKI